MRALKKYLLALLAGALMLIAAAACKSDPVPEALKPTLTVSEASVSGKVRDRIALPDATATDYFEKDISEEIRIKIYFKEDEEYVLPQKNASLGVLLSQNKTFTPKKCGEYVITYFVTDEYDGEAESEVALTVAANPDSVLAQNLASVNNTENWLYGESGQNSALNEFGEITIAGKNESTAYGGASYSGQKINNGDTVTVDFVGQEPTNVWFYDFAYFLTPSAGLDAPTASEAVWPSYFHIRILKNAVQGYLFTLNNNNFVLSDQMNVSLLDGKQHSLSLKVEASEERVEVYCWIDKAITTTPSAMNVILKEDVEAKNPGNQEALAPFNSGITGWLSFGANITGKNISNDGLVIKGVTINGETDLKTPSLKIGNIGKMQLNEEITLPDVSARDENDYSDLTSKVKLVIATPSGEEAEITEKTYTPTAAGEYIFRYTVTDGRGNLGYQVFPVLCSKGDSTEKPVIEFDGEIEDTLTVKLNEPVSILKPAAVTDSFSDDIASRLKIELTGREKANLNDADTFTFRAAGENVLRYSVTDYNGNETVIEIKIIVTDGVTGNILEKSDDWYLTKTTNDKSADTLRINGGGANVVYGGQKIYDEKVSILWNYDIAETAGGADGTNILMINLRGGKPDETVKTANNPTGGTNWGWPEGLSVCISRHYGILVKFGGWGGVTVGTSVTEPDALYGLFHGKDTELSMKATDTVDENGQTESVRVEVWLDGEKVKFAGSYVDSAGDVLLNKRYLRSNPGVLAAGWLEFYFNETDTVSDEKTVIKSITLDGTKPVQTLVTIDKENDQEFIMNEPYTLPVVTVTVGEEDKSSEVKTYIAAVGTDPDFTADPYTQATITPDMDYIRGFVVYYVYGEKVVKTVNVSNSSTVEITLSAEAVTGAKVGTEFLIPTVTQAMLGSLDVTDDISAKIKVGVFEYDAEGAYKPTSDEPVVINYYFYGKSVKTVTVTVAPDVNRTTDFSGWVSETPQHVATWQSQRIYNNKLYVRFSFQKEFTAGDLYEFTLRGGETNLGAWMGNPTGLNLALYRDGNSVKFRVHANPIAHWPQVIYGESASSYAELDWTARHSLVYSVYDKYDGDTFLGVTVEVWLDGEKVQFVKGADGAVIDGNVLIAARTVLENPADRNGRKIFRDGFFGIFGMQNGAPIDKAVNVHHAYIMRPTDELPDMPEDPAVFTIDKEENQEFTIGQAYTLPVLTVKVGTDDRSNRVKVYITALAASLDLETATAYTDTTFIPAQEDYLGITVHYVYEGEVVKTVTVANSASVEIVLSAEEITDVKTGTAFTVPTIDSATLSGHDVKDEITIKIVFGETETDATAGDSYTPLLAGSYTIIFSFNGKTVKTLEVEVAEGDDALEVTLSEESVNAQVGKAFTVPAVVSAMLGDVDHKSEISVKLLIGTKTVEEAETYTPWYDETIYIVYSFGDAEVKRLEVIVEPADEKGSDLADYFEQTPVNAMKYAKQFLYNNKAVLNFSVENDLVDGDNYEFGLRGGEQTSVGWCNYTQGLRIRLQKNVFGVYFTIIWGDNGAVTLAESVNKYTDLDWTAAHTMVYGAYDVYDEEGGFRGILVELWLDGSLVSFNLSGAGTANGASVENGKVLISAEKANEEPKDSAGVSVFDKSLFYVWYLSGAKKIAVHHAYIVKPNEEAPDISATREESL